MTSVQNHRPRSSGNKGKLLFFCFVLSWTACSPKLQPSGKQPEPQMAVISKNDTLPTIKREILRPDTLIWKDVSDEFIPVREPKNKVSDSGKKASDNYAGFKDSYNIQLFIPLKSNEYTPNSLADNRFVQFYTGMLLAMEDLEKDGLSLKIKVEDTGDQNFNIKESWTRIENAETDLIIGPFEREDLKFIAGEAARKKITVVSPWQTSTKIATGNPHYIQLKPNLKEHFKRMTEHACQHFSPGQIMVVTHANQEGTSWYNYIKDACSNITGSTESLRHFAVIKDSLIAPNTAFVNVFRENPPAAVILPYYSFNDEQKLYEVVRRLIVDKGNHKVALYAMPLFLESDKIDFEFYASFITRVAISDFTDEKNYRVRQFKRKYFELFGELSGPDALKGYDVMMFIGKNLMEYGLNFQKSLVGNKQVYLQTQIELHETSGDNESNRSPGDFDFYENKHISILEFKNAGFEIID